MTPTHAPHLTAPAGALPGERPSRLTLWIRATRPLYLPTSVVPALAGALVAIGAGDADWWLLPVALVALLLVHAATDVCNEVEDAAHGVDSPDKMDNSQVFSRGLLSVGEGRRLYGALFGVAFLLGVGICAVQGPELLVIGVIGILGGWLYTGGPRPYKYDGLGDPAIVLLMGPLLTQGAYTAVTGDGFHAPAFWLGMAPGLLIASVLAANNASDIEGDRAAGVRTLAVRIGFGRARALFLAALAGAFAALVVLWAVGLFSAWILLPLVLLPAAAARARQALAARRSGDEALLTLAPQTAQLHLLFSVLLCAAVVLDRL
ncbi:MAG TPA: 1,4-dihydroxy-2-naphthoate octaprenyltransferase [Capillimicrobium sp.]|nr:1,4-dihydroxy-2-naphthoate octaprenyltransferase [Capillimicrobium sp.]